MEKLVDPHENEDRLGESLPNAADENDAIETRLVSDTSGDGFIYLYAAPGYGAAQRSGCWWLRKRDDDADEWRDVCPLPSVLAAYDRGNGLTYVLDVEGQRRTTTWEQLRKGDVWWMWHIAIPRGNAIPAAHAIQAIAKRLPMQGLSPRPAGGYPPQAPRLVPTPRIGAELGREAWAQIGPMLAPAGRLVIGCVLMSPWLREAGCVSSVIALMGEAGAGKTALAQLAAAAFGPNEVGADDGLLQPMDTTGQGLTAVAQDRSFLPVLMDEVTDATTDPQPTLVRLVQGARRMRATRAGDAVRSTARWDGLVVTTANETLTAHLRHEMWARRLIEWRADELWAAPDWDRLMAWGTGLLAQAEGWPWQALTADYPLTDEGVAEVVARVQREWLPQSSNLGRVLRLGLVGCAWLANWTGDPSWAEGTQDAAIAILIRQAENRPDPARDSARAIVEHHVAHPGALAPRRGSHRRAAGYRRPPRRRRGHLRRRARRPVRLVAHHPRPVGSDHPRQPRAATRLGDRLSSV